jgi:alkylated DNA repair dioxygenase AlkB
MSSTSPSVGAGPRGLRGAGFREHEFAGFPIWEGRLPDELSAQATREFEALWQIKPDERHPVVMRGRSVRVRRFQQNFDHDYAYTGSVARARPRPSDLDPYFAWLQQDVSASANGLLLNWYRADHVHEDGKRGDYLSAHHDKNRGQLARGSLIVCISFGDPRRVRFSKTGVGSLDLCCHHGHVYAFSVEANDQFKHGIPHPLKTEYGRRISLTARTFR